MKNVDALYNCMDADVSHSSCDDGISFQPGVIVWFDPPKDGNSQFSVVCEQLFFNTSVERQLTARIIRQEVVEHLSSRPFSREGCHFSNFVFPITDWGKYLMLMKQNGTFGDCITLSAIEQLYTVQIVVMSTLGLNGTRAFLPTLNCYDPSLPVLLLGHTAEGRGDHYVSLKATTNEIMTCIVNDALKVDSVLTVSLPDGCSACPDLVSVNPELPVACNVFSDKPDIPFNISVLSPSQRSTSTPPICSNPLPQPAHEGVNVSHKETNLKLHILAIWSLDQYIGKQKKYPWLFANNQKLGCSICQSVVNLGVEKTQGVKIMRDWTDGTVGFYGDSREKELLSLRKKMHKHKVSVAHKTCEKIWKSTRNNLQSFPHRSQYCQKRTTISRFGLRYRFAGT